MIPWVRLAAAAAPGGGELKLMQRGAEFSIMIGSDELMNSRRGGSEAALATLACARLADRPAARFLIGGLGMGFTLRAALEKLGPKAEVVVAELVPAVVAWARQRLADDPAACLIPVAEALPEVPQMRVDEAEADLLRRAAAATDQTVTDFVLTSAMIEAEKVLADRRHFVVERIRWDELIELLDAPLPSTTRLRALKARRDPFTDDGA